MVVWYIYKEFERSEHVKKDINIQQMFRDLLLVSRRFTSRHDDCYSLGLIIITKHTSRYKETIDNIIHNTDDKLTAMVDECPNIRFQFLDRSNRILLFLLGYRNFHIDAQVSDLSAYFLSYCLTVVCYVPKAFTYIASRSTGYVYLRTEVVGPRLLPFLAIFTVRINFRLVSE